MGYHEAIKRYQTVQVQTATQGELLLLLYDGLFRFLNEAIVAMEAKQRGRTGERIDRAYCILVELVGPLKPEVCPDLCRNLEAVYVFCMGHLVRANLEQNPNMIREIIRVLSPLRDAWYEAVRQHTAAEQTQVAQAAAQMR